MPAMNGRAVIVELDGVDLKDDLRTKTVNFNGELADVTTDGDLGWMTTLDDTFNTQNVSLALEGVLKNDTLSDMAFKGEKKALTITVGTLFTLTGNWKFQSGFSIGAPHNGEVTFSGTLQSEGPITKAAV